MNRKRKEDESFEQYKANMKNENYAIKNYLMGKLVWASQFQGPVVGKYGTPNDRKNKRAIKTNQNKLMEK